jgi:hypothetical protein
MSSNKFGSGEAYLNEGSDTQADGRDSQDCREIGQFLGVSGNSLVGPFVLGLISGAAVLIGGSILLWRIWGVP